MVWLVRGDPARARSKVGVPTTVPTLSRDHGGSDASDHRDRPAQGDPHAVAVNGSEHEVARLKIRAIRDQVAKLLTWAVPFPSRRWAIEGAEGLGFLLAQLVIDAGRCAHRTTIQGPGGQQGTTPSQRDRSRILATGSSAKSLPDPHQTLRQTATTGRTHAPAHARIGSVTECDGCVALAS